jgi:O-acetyl-ADP-ribose deacetylase (regulator of RNase III)
MVPKRLRPGKRPAAASETGHGGHSGRFRHGGPGPVGPGPGLGPNLPSPFLLLWRSKLIPGILALSTLIRARAMAEPLPSLPDTAPWARIRLVQGDITRLDADAIVNAANERLLPGGGVCGAIHQAAGPALARACAAIGHCPPGEARITPGFCLKARQVIHAVGPVWRSGRCGEPECLRRAYLASLDLCQRHGLASVAMPLISTGIYGFPLDRACAVALQALADWLREHPWPREAVLVAYDARAMAALTAARTTMGAAASPWGNGDGPGYLRP